MILSETLSRFSFLVFIFRCDSFFSIDVLKKAVFFYCSLSQTPSWTWLHVCGINCCSLQVQLTTMEVFISTVLCCWDSLSTTCPTPRNAPMSRKILFNRLQLMFSPDMHSSLRTRGLLLKLVPRFYYS